MVCGERVALMTAPAPGALGRRGCAHRAPPFPTALALEPVLPGGNFQFPGKSRVAVPDRNAISIQTINAAIDFSIQSLATKTSEHANAALRFANAQVTALGAHLEARPKAAAH